MQRKITVFAPWMEADLRQRIMDRVQETGLKAAFFDREEDAAADARDAEILFGVSRQCLSEARELRWLCVPFAGIDSLRDLIPEGIRLSNGAGAYGITISEHVVMVLLMMLRHAEQTLKDMGAKVWRKAGAMETLYDKRVLILGTGDIGRECASRLAAFRVKRISGVNRSGHAAEGFDEVCALQDSDRLFPGADIVISCLPGTDETENALSRERIFSMPEGSYLVNVGRGRSVDEAALADALRCGHLAGASLDVMRREPLPADDPLWDAPNLLLTPHCAGDMTAQVTRENCVRMFLCDLDNYLEGRPFTYGADKKKGY